MLRISEVSASGGGVVLRLEGELMGPWIAEVNKACEPYLELPPLLTLDLTDISYVDREGIKLLKRFLNLQVRLITDEPFIIEQLKTEG